MGLITQNTLTIQDRFNPTKEVQFKMSKCHHFYQRQLISGKPITNWQRAVKKSVYKTLSNFNHTTI